MILVGDLGGTNCRLACFERNRLTRVALYRSPDFNSFEDIITRYIKDNKLRVSAACFGVPGPVVHGVAELTNLTWTVSEVSLSKFLKSRHVRVINDFVALGHGISSIPKTGLVRLNQVRPERDGTLAVIGAGTGLGMAIVPSVGGKRMVLPSEGGSSALCPESDIEWGFAQYARRLYGSAVVESAVSGPGILNIYEFLRGRHEADESPTVREDLKKMDKSAVIAEHALYGQDGLCLRTIEMFINFYARAASNLAITSLATGGLYIAGGIAPKLLPKLTDGAFMRSFLGEGVARQLLERVPVFVVTDGLVGLRGAGVASSMD